MIIDINAYCGNWPYYPIRVRSNEALVSLLDKFNIDQAAITSTKGIFVAAAAGNEDTAAMVAQSPSRLLAFATVTPTDDKPAVEQLRRCAAQGMKGLRLFPQHHGYRLDDDPVLADILDACQELALPVLIPIRLMANWSMPTLDVREIGNLAARFPAVQFIVGGCNYGEVRDTLGVMRRQPNVAMETSCLQLHEGVRTFVERAGAERVYFGSGLPLQYPGPGLAKIIHAQISDAAKELILGGNAQRLIEERR